MNERKLTKSELKKREDIIMKMKDNKRDLVKKYGKDAEAVMYGRATNMAKKQTKEMRDPKLTELIKDALKNPKKADLNKDGKLSDYEEKRGAAIEKAITKEAYSDLSPEDKKTVGTEYDYEDIGQFYLEGFGKEHSLTQDQLGKLGRQITDRLYDGDIGKAYDDVYKKSQNAAVNRLASKGQLINPMTIDEAELPTSIIQKLSSEIKDAQGFAKAMIGIYDAIQDKEQKDYSKSQKFGKVLSLLKDIADDKVEAEVTEDLDLGHEDNEPHMLKADLYRIGKYAMELYQMVDQFEGMGEVDFPSWWQSKVFKAKDALVGAKHYLDFEINEPKIDAVVDVATDVVDEEINQLGTDSDTGFQASLYTPNEMGAAAVGREYASGAFEENQQPIKEDMNYDKWRRAFNGKNFAKKTILLEDYNNNKKRYEIRFKYQETPKADVVSVSETHFGGHEGSGLAFAMSNMQTKPRFLFTADDKFEFDSEEEFEKWLESGEKGLENLLSFLLGGEFADDAIERHLETGVYKIVKIKESEYFPSAVVNENKSSKYSTVAEKLAKELKEGLPKGFWDKKMKAKDEVDEGMPGDPERFVGSGGDEIDQDSNINVTKDNPAQDAEIGFGLEEDYDSLVNKIKKQGKSEKAAKAIAGAVASYKAKGGGKGPTAKQK
jgi:hypothetical protein